MDFKQILCRPLCIPRSPGMKNYYNKAVVAGWGCTKYPKAYSYIDKLGFTTDTIMAIDDCRNMYINVLKRKGFYGNASYRAWIPNEE